MERRIKINDREWIIHLDDDGQLSLAYITLYAETVYATDPLWHDWDTDPETAVCEFKSFHQAVNSEVNVFRVKRIILPEIRKMISDTKTSFFYFQPNTEKKASVYHRVASDLVKELGDDWTLQDYTYWYYFNKT